MKYVICIVGPTAVGKSALALELAQTLNTEILSSDSRQIYRQLDIGTAKPTQAEMELLPHHFINVLAPDQAYNAARFAEDAEATLAKLLTTHNQAIVVGGSTLYMNALWFGFDEIPTVPQAIRKGLMLEFEQKGLEPLLAELKTHDPQTYEHIDQRNHARVIRALEVFRATQTPISHFRTGRTEKPTPWTWIKIGLKDDRKKLYERIDQRVLDMVEAGLESEVRQQVEKYGPEAPGLQSIGYSEMISFIQGEIDFAECIRLIQRNSRRYAKRQLTWFRRYEDIHWFEAGRNEEVMTWVKKQIESQ